MEESKRDRYIRLMSKAIEEPEETQNPWPVQLTKEAAQEVIDLLKRVPDKNVVNIEKQELIAWLSGYHTKSYELKARYAPHEVISWLINDLIRYIDRRKKEENNGQ